MIIQADPTTVPTEEGARWHYDRGLEG
jgi:hypothetical protein